ncbi:MAG: methylenetetrahydrofolate reductase [Candidatus Eremiobacteraeota bacterium]|nr:methylenetetrahydrofolate reductase [Candidatus Eremiobacteraeota bacterium]
MKAGSTLEKVLKEGHKAVTVELGPPKSANAAVIEKKAGILKGCADAVNITDNQTAVVRMSSLASSVIALRLGLEPVLQMVTRDRNRIALQSDVLGAAALGIKNILVLSGDHQKFGNHGGAKNVFDIDSIQLLSVLRTMRDEKKFQSGDVMKVEPRLFLGAACNPFADPLELSVMRLAKKVRAGADFIQTQAVFDLERFREFMKEVCARGLHEQTAILAGVVPLKSVKAALHMRDNVAGVGMPDCVIKRMEGASDQKEEGKALALETIREVLAVPGVRGLHLMAIEWEEAVPELVEKAGLLPRPTVSQESPGR